MVQPNLSDEDEFYLDDFPNGFVYIPPEWRSLSGETVVFLKVHH